MRVPDALGLLVRLAALFLWVISPEPMLCVRTQSCALRRDIPSLVLIHKIDAHS